jgi:phage terminase large subunit-like protein
MPTTKKKGAKKKRKRGRPRKDPYGVPAADRKLLMLIPGYDPFRDARGYHYDPELAAKAVDFFEEVLTHQKGRWAPQNIKLEKWQKAILMNLWGWRTPEGKRRYRRLFMYLPKKNSKSTMGSGIALLILRTDHEPGARIVGCAHAKQQAGYIFEDAAGMVRKSKWLSQGLKIFGARGGSVERMIAYDDEMANYRVSASDPATFDGANIHAAIVDELHRFDDTEFVDLVEQSTTARDNWLIVYATTADSARKESACNMKLAKARNVRDGIDRDARFLPAIWETTDEDDWTDPMVWKRVNPNWGVSVDPEEFRSAFEEAKKFPSKQANFKRLRLNMVTDAAKIWIPSEWWTKCGPAVDPADPYILQATRRDEMLAELAGQECVAGLDVSVKNDLTALTLIFSRLLEKDGYTSRLFRSLHWFWCPRERAEERSRREEVPYLAWAEAGWIELTPGDIIDHGRIETTICDLSRVVRIMRVGVDPAYSAWVVQRLQDARGFEVELVRQGWQTLSDPCKEFEAAVQAGTWSHDGSPVMGWNVRNCVAWRDKADNITPDKKQSNERIDGVSATVTALALAISQAPPDRGSPWSDDDRDSPWSQALPTVSDGPWLPNREDG